MRGIGNSLGGAGLAPLGIMAGVGALATLGLSPIGYSEPVKRLCRGTGWRDRAYQHPQGPCAFKPVGSKRRHRRNGAKLFARCCAEGVSHG